MAREYKNRPAKKQLYGGTTYRSRTEAAWAQVFDFMRWEHAYEPELLDGWSPDFVINRNPDNGGRLWIEVKPAYDVFWAAVRRHMENSRLDKRNDVLGFVYRHVDFVTEPVKFGRIGLWDTLDGEKWGWWWWDGVLWWADDPVNKWGLAVPDIEREIILSDREVEAAGGIVY